MQGRRFIGNAPDENFFDPESETWADPRVAGGGDGHAQLSHSLGMLFWLTGLKASQVYALMTAPNSQVEIYNAISVRFNDGSIGTVSGAGNIPRQNKFHVDHRIFGSEGVLMLDCDRPRMEIQRYDGDNFRLELESEAGAYSCDGPPNNFVDLILGNVEDNFAPGWAAARSVELLDAAYRSVQSGKAENV